MSTNDTNQHPYEPGADGKCKVCGQPEDHRWHRQREDA